MHRRRTPTCTPTYRRHLFVKILTFTNVCQHTGKSVQRAHDGVCVFMWTRRHVAFIANARWAECHFATAAFTDSRCNNAFMQSVHCSCTKCGESKDDGGQNIGVKTMKRETFVWNFNVLGLFTRHIAN